MDATKPGSKYSFAFCDPRYSDCLLNLYTNGTTEDGCGPRAVPASSAVLAANSRFFKTMLSGDFNESSNKTAINIHLEAPSDVCFMDLMRFMHTETLPPEASSSLQRATELLILADRFEVEECIVACARELKSLLPITSSKDALLVLSLPQSLREDPRLKEVVDAASQFLVIQSSAAMHQAGLENPNLIRVLHPELLKERREAVHHTRIRPNVFMAIIQAFKEVTLEQCTRKARKDLLEYPEEAMKAVLESKRLEGDSEDSVANAVLAWAMHRSTNPQEVLDTLFSFILPRLCLRSLSPSLLQSLLSLLKSCSSSTCNSQQLAPTLSACMADEAAPPLSPGMAPSTPTEAASSGPLLYSPGALLRATCHRRSNDKPVHATSQGAGASHATSPGFGASRPDDPLVDPMVGRDEASNSCHPSCSTFLDSGRDVLPLCVTMCRGVTARPEAEATALGVFADAMVDLSEQNFIRTQVLATGRPFDTEQAQAPLLLPPRSVALSSGCLCLDVPWRIAGTPLVARGYPASTSNLVVATPDVFASGRWLKLAVYLDNSSSPRLDVFLEKSSEMQETQQANLEASTKWRSCFQTSSSQPAFECFLSGTLSDQEQSVCVGSIPLHDTGKNMYFSQNMLRMRVDTWSA